MMGPSYRPAGGGSDPALEGRVAALEAAAQPPVIVDEDIEIPVVGGDLPAAIAEAMTYRGRMAPNRRVTVRLPAGRTEIDSTVSFRNINFPELDITGQESTALWVEDYDSTIDITRQPSEDVTGLKAFHIVFPLQYGEDGGAIAGDIVTFGYYDVPFGSLSLAHSALISGAFEVVSKTETSITVRAFVGSAYPNADTALPGSYDVGDLGVDYGVDFLRLPSVLACSEAWSGGPMFDVAGAAVGAIGGFAMRLPDGPDGVALHVARGGSVVVPGEDTKHVATFPRARMHAETDSVIDLGPFSQFYGGSLWADTRATMRLGGHWLGAVSGVALRAKEGGEITSTRGIALSESWSAAVECTGLSTIQTWGAAKKLPDSGYEVTASSGGRVWVVDFGDTRASPAFGVPAYDGTVIYGS